MFYNYLNNHKEFRDQHNIMVLVGNGFDIAAIKQMGESVVGKNLGKTTSYRDFFEYITYYRLCNSDNSIYNKMKHDRDQGKNNWCDFELSIDELLYSGDVDYLRLEDDLDELQICFTGFLNDIVSTPILLELSKMSRENAWAEESLGCFLHDLPYGRRIDFQSRIDHYHLMNFLFVNFNYTSLLDDYIYLDKEQFEPRIYNNSDMNFSIHSNTPFLGSETEALWSSSVLVQVIHPNGVQDVPRSLIFGTEREVPKRGKTKRFIKSYWAQCDLKYEGYFEDTGLFIIFGMSLSITDGWWMKKILKCLLCRIDAELIIYVYQDSRTEAEIIDAFIESSGHVVEFDKKEILKKKICIIHLDDNNNHFLGFRKRKSLK